MRLHLDHHKDTSEINNLGRQCEEVAARCRALDARLKSFGVTVEIPEFKQPKKFGPERFAWDGRRCTYGAGLIMAARLEHNRRIERLLLGALSLVVQQLPDADGGIAEPE